MTPRRVQLSRQGGWSMPANTVKVDRSTSYGNPFKPDAPPAHLPLEACLRQFEELAASWDLAPLRGKNLACWCRPDAACHADILLRLANAPEARQVRIVANDGVIHFEGDDYTDPAWKPGRHIIHGGRAHEILSNGIRDGLRVILVSSIAKIPKPEPSPA